jgi:hypothetical protein
MYIFNKNKELNFNSQWLNYFIKNSNLKETNNQDNSAIFMAFFNNKSQNLFFNEEQWNYLFQNSDLKHQDTLGFNPLMLAINYYKKEQLNFTEKQWNYLLEHSDLIQHNIEGINALMFALENKKNLPLTQKQWNHLINNSDLTQQNNFDWTPLMYALFYLRKQNLFLTQEEFKIMYQPLNEKQKQNVFLFMIDIYSKNNNSIEYFYFEKIKSLLYDYQFQPTEETIHWLQEKNHQDILQMIEKRNVLFQLEKDFQLMDKQEKLNIIKI